VIARLVLCLGIAVAPAIGAQTNGGAERQAAGAFTQDQVTRGELAFQKYCLSCHAPTFHTGDQFRHSWIGRTVYDYFKVVKTTMPEDNPGGLTNEEYTVVLAYILKLNGYPTGTHALPTDSLALQRIRIGPVPSDTVKPTKR
jgi:mono/diheme cytochrome c family protein